jgi:hypothetical protein
MDGNDDANQSKKRYPSEMIHQYFSRPRMNDGRILFCWGRTENPLLHVLRAPPKDLSLLRSNLCLFPLERLQSIYVSIFVHVELRPSG